MEDKMKISFQLWGQLKQAAGTGKVDIEIEDNSTIEQIVYKLIESQGDEIKKLLIKDDKISPTMLFFINDQQIDTESNVALSENTEISIMSPIAGGK
jgi:molybdopterin converting factor small subunit